MTDITIVKVNETPEGIRVRARVDGETQYLTKNLQSYVMIYQDDFEDVKFIFDKYCSHADEFIDRDGLQYYKLFLKNNYLRNKLRNEIEDESVQVFEGDITANKRFVLEYEDKLNQDKLKTAWYDIETWDLKGFDRDFKGNVKASFPILSIAMKEYLHDSNGEEKFFRNEGLDTPQFDDYRTLVQELLEMNWIKKNINRELMTVYADEENDNELLKKELKIADKEIKGRIKIQNEAILKWEEAVTSALQKGEEIMLKLFLEEAKNYDMLSAYNGSAFDDIFVRDRSKIYGMDSDAFMIVNFDYYLSYLKNNYNPVKSYKLDNVAYEELKGELGKENSSLTNPDEIRKVDWKSFTNAEKYFHLFLCYPKVLKEYNIVDVRLLDMLEKKLNFFKLHSVQCEISKCLMIDTLYNSRICDNLMLVEYNNRKMIAPTKPNQNTVEQRKNKIPPGGYTFIFKKGLHKEVFTYDFGSFYPSAQITFNISPETFLRSVSPDLNKVFNGDEIEYIKYSIDIAKEYIGADNKLKNKRYEDDIEKKRLEYESVDTMHELMFKFVEKYDNLIEHRENETYTPADFNRDARGWNIHDHFVFSTDEEGIQPKILRELLTERNVVKYSLKDFEYGSFEWWEAFNYQLGLKILANCFSLDTEVMTVDGAKNICDVKVGEKVFSLNLETECVEEATVIDTILQDHNGEMIHFKNRNTDLIVTPDHRMVKHNFKNDRSYFSEAKECFKYALHIPMHKNIPKRENIKKIYLFDFLNFEDYDYQIFKYGKDLRTLKVELRKYNLDIVLRNKNSERCFLSGDKESIRKLIDLGYHVKMRHSRNGNCKFSDCVVDDKTFSKICGWYIADGSSHKSKEVSYGKYARNDRNNKVYEMKRGITKCIQIAKYIKSDGRKEIKQGIRDLGIDVREEPKVLSFSNDAWFDILTQFGNYGYEKHIPEKFKKYLDYQILFDSMYMCDGDKRGFRYSTTSEKLKNQLKEICFYIGRNFSSSLEKVNLPNRKDVWRIYCSSNKKGKHIRKGSSKYIDGHNKVACITLDKNNTVYAGRNDNLVWTGQSLYGFGGFRGSRFYRIQLPTAVTSACRYINKRAIFLARQKGFEVVAGDTDSIFIINDGEKIDTDKLDLDYYEFFDELIKPFNTSCKVEMDNPLTKEKEVKNHRLIFEYEKDAEFMISVARKRYYYRIKDKISSVGGASKRSDTIKLGSDLQKEILADIFYEKFDKDLWLKKLLDLKKKIFEHKLEEEHLIKTQAISKDVSEYGKPMMGKDGLQKITKAGVLRFSNIPANVKLAKRMIEDGEYVNIGDKIPFIVAKNPPIVPITPQEFRETKEYDEKYYHSAITKPVLEIVLTVYPELTYTHFRDCWALTERQIKKLQSEIEESEGEEDD